MSLPLVSICCLTYNHGPFIGKCLDGFLMQQVDFPFEILIHDDASMDRTQEIIKEYQARYPEIIKPILQTENQYLKGVRGISLHFNFPRAGGKYIALCEGDDYWTDLYKLQKQVDFLENNPNFSLTCGGFIKKNVKSGVESVDIIDEIELFPRRRENGFEFSLNDLHKKWLTKTLTVVLRRDLLNTEELFRFKYLRDIHLFHQLIKKGEGFYFTQALGVYHIHEGGIHSQTSERLKIDTAYQLYSEFHKLEKDSYTRIKRFNITLKALHFYKHPPDRVSLRRQIGLALESIRAAGSFKDILRVVLVFLGLK